MRRRDFIASVGAIATWPTGARTQQATSTRRVSALMGLAETDPFTIKYVYALNQCPLSEVKRTWSGLRKMSAFDRYR